MDALNRRAFAAIRHPGVVTVYEIGASGGLDFIAMEYVEEESLDALIARAPLDLGRGLPYATQIAEALWRAHERRIIHRDLKPRNLMITTRNDAKILDFKPGVHELWLMELGS